MRLLRWTGLRKETFPCLEPDRSFPVDFKAKIVLELLSGAASQAELCRKHNLKPQLLGHWRSAVLERLHTPQPAPYDEGLLKTAFLDVPGEWAAYGYRGLTAMTCRLDWPGNAKRVRRWMNGLGIHGAPAHDTHHQQQPRVSAIPDLVADPQITRPDQVWARNSSTWPC
jgi:hypothetical protein